MRSFKSLSITQQRLFPSPFLAIKNKRAIAFQIFIAYTQAFNITLQVSPETIMPFMWFAPSSFSSSHFLSNRANTGHLPAVTISNQHYS